MMNDLRLSLALQKWVPYRVCACLLAGLFLSSCSSLKVRDSREFSMGSLQRPATIWVYTFAATQADLHEGSVMAPHFTDHVQQEVRHIVEGRALSRELAQELTAEIRSMGMPGMLATGTTTPQIGDLVILGSLISFDEGSAAKRLTIGFGAGKSSMCVAAESYVVTSGGLRELGSETLDAGSKKSPGLALGLATFIATDNPAGLILSTSTKLYGEVSGRSKVQGRAKATAKEIAKALQTRFQEAGWL